MSTLELNFIDQLVNNLCVQKLVDVDIDDDKPYPLDGITVQELSIEDLLMLVCELEDEADIDKPYPLDGIVVEELEVEEILYS